MNASPLQTSPETQPPAHSESLPQTQAVNRFELVTYAFVLIMVTIGLALSLTNLEFFEDTYVLEDGLIEWLTVVGFVLGGVALVRRVVMLRRVRSLRFIAATALLALAFFFVAGEEVSWGQRLFNIESPEFFEAHNAQAETNFHNLRIGEVKLNKLIFSQAVAVVMVLYFCVLSPLYGRKAAVTRFADGWAIPIPKWHQALACVVMLIITQVLVQSSKRGELAEFGGAFLFTLIVAFPSNRAAFDPRT